MYECHYVEKGGYYLKSRSEVVRLISCLPISNKTMKDNFLIASGEWSDGFHCPTRAGIPGAAPLGPILLGKGLSSLDLLSFFACHKFCSLILISFSAVLQIELWLLPG